MVYIKQFYAGFQLKCDRDVIYDSYDALSISRKNHESKLPNLKQCFVSRKYKIKCLFILHLHVYFRKLEICIREQYFCLKTIIYIIIIYTHYIIIIYTHNKYIISIVEMLVPAKSHFNIPKWLVLYVFSGIVNVVVRMVKYDGIHLQNKFGRENRCYIQKERILYLSIINSPKYVPISWSSAMNVRQTYLKFWRISINWNRNLNFNVVCSRSSFKLTFRLSK